MWTSVAIFLVGSFAIGVGAQMLVGLPPCWLVGHRPVKWIGDAERCRTCLLWKHGEEYRKDTPEC